MHVVSIEIFQFWQLRPDYHLVTNLKSIYEVLHPQVFKLFLVFLLLVLHDDVSRLQIQDNLDGFVPHFNVVARHYNILNRRLFFQAHPQPFLHFFPNLKGRFVSIRKRNFLWENGANFLKGDKFKLFYFFMKVVIRVPYK